MCRNVPENSSEDMADGERSEMQVAVLRKTMTILVIMRMPIRVHERENKIDAKSQDREDL